MQWLSNSLLSPVFRQVFMVHRLALGCKTVTKVSAQISIYLVDVYSRLSFCTVLSHCCQFTSGPLQTICAFAILHHGNGAGTFGAAAVRACR